MITFVLVCDYVKKHIQISKNETFLWDNTFTIQLHTYKYRGKTSVMFILPNQYSRNNQVSHGVSAALHFKLIAPQFVKIYLIKLFNIIPILHVQTCSASQ